MCCGGGGGGGGGVIAYLHDTCLPLCEGGAVDTGTSICDWIVAVFLLSTWFRWDNSVVKSGLGCELVYYGYCLVLPCHCCWSCLFCAVRYIVAS